MIPNLRLLLIFNLLLTTFSSFSSDFYVATDGSDTNSGSIMMPWKTVQYGVDQIQAGDQLLLRAGTYNEKIEFYESGALGQRIYIKNYNNESVIIDGSNLSNSAIFYFENLSYLTIQGIHFQNNTINGGAGIMAQGACHDIEILDNKISNIFFSSDPSATVTNNTNSSPLLFYADSAPDSAYNILIQGNEVFNNRTGFSENISLDGNISLFEISNNIVHDNTNIGIDVLGNYQVSPMPALDHARYGVVKNNTIFNCDAPYSPAAGIYVDGGHHVVVENNISHHNGYGGEIGCEESGTTDDIIFRNNIFYQNKFTGMHIGGYDFQNTGGKVINSKVLNNTFYKNDSQNDYNGELIFTQFENGMVQNNIFYLTDQNVFAYAYHDQPNLNMDYNILYASDGESQLEGEWQGTEYSGYEDFKTKSNSNSNSDFVDPQFSNAANNDFHLSAASPAKENGNPAFVAASSEKDMDGEDRLQGSVVDCGADEALSNSTPSEGENMTLKSTWDMQNSSQSGVKYNDLWGYVDCQGNEYAILGSAQHVHIIDVTNSTQPSEVKRFTPGSSTIWRDFKTYKTFAYGVADQGNEGLLVFDLTNLPGSNISMVNQLTADFTKCHNIFIDEVYGKLYVVGSNTKSNGVIVYDISQDPANPVKIASPSLAQGGYIHDAYVKNNILYGSHGYNGFYVWDFTNPTNPVQLANIQTNGYNHSNWVTDDGNYAVIAEEVPSGLPLLMIDLTDLANNNIEVVKSFKDPLLAPSHVNSTPHNPYVRGNYVVTSYYEDGVQIHDISDPLNPVRVAYYDTEPGNTSYHGTTGNWGMYPYFPSGNIIASDTKHGLFVLTADNITFQTIQAPSNPNTEISAEGGNTMCFGGEKELIATQGAESFVWYRNGNLIETTLSNSITISEVGAYHVIGTSGFCTSQSSTIQITENDEINVNIESSLGLNFCSNNTNTLTASDGFSYNWSNEATSQSIDVTTSGTYTVTVTDDLGCTGIGTYSVTTNDLPIISIEAANMVLCNGESTSITASSEGIFQWSTGQTNPEIEVNEAGIYTVTVTNPNNCQAIAEIEITDGGAIEATIESSNGTFICEGESTELTVSTAQNYLWSNGSDEQSITASEEGLYSVTITNENGCTSTGFMQIGVSQAPDGSIEGSSSLCNNGSIILTGFGGANYLWSTDQTTQEITVTTPGNYVLTITNSAGCTQVIEHGVTDLPNLTPVISSNSTVICSNQTLSLTASGGTIFLWNTGAESSTIDIDDAGQYSVTVTDNNGCSGTTSINIEQVEFNTTIEGDLSLCANQSGTLQVTNGVSWIWNTGSTSNTIIITQAGEYSVTTTSSDGCSATSTVTVSESENISLELQSSNGLNLCFGESTTLSTTSGYSFYLWSNGSTDQEVTVTTSGIYSLTVTNSFGCTGSAEINISSSEFSVEIQGDLSICGEEGGVIEVSAGVSWLWSNGKTTQAIDIFESGNYSVTATDENGCTAIAEVSVEDGQDLQIEIISSNGLSICNGVSTTLSLNNTAFSSYNWSTTAISDEIIVTQAGIYSVTVTNASGCTGVDQIEISQTEVLASIDAPSQFCKNTSITMQASGGVSYLWNNQSTDNSIDISDPGHYFVTVTDENGCTGVADHMIAYYPNFQPVITTNDIPLCIGNEVTLTVLEGTNFIWSNQSDNQSIDVTENGTYSVTVTDKNGCTGTTEINIAFNDKPEGQIVASNGLEFCKGSSTLLSIDNTNLTQVLWFHNNENLGSSNQITAITSGTYFAKLDLNGCTAITNDIEVLVNEPVIPEIEQSTTTLSSTSATSFQWYFNDILISDQTEQTITPLLTGDYYVITVDENGCVGQSITINFVVTGTETIDWISNSKLFPNPTHAWIYLEIESLSSQHAKIKIRNLLGQVFTQKSVEIQTSQNRFQFDTQNYASGMYFMEIESNGQVSTLKFVVER